MKHSVGGRRWTEMDGEAHRMRKVLRVEDAKWFLFRRDILRVDVAG